jgi:hypothetical protein
VDADAHGAGSGRRQTVFILEKIAGLLQRKPKPDSTPEELQQKIDALQEFIRTHGDDTYAKIKRIELQRLQRQQKQTPL